jgi:Xaa-Pro aminopeptidase
MTLMQAPQEKDLAPEENVGVDFREDQLLVAQAKAWRAIEAVAAEVRPGWKEVDALALLKERLKDIGYTKMWHPPQIRFGVNTTLPFAKPSDPDVRLGDEDVFFLDIGPLFGGYEGDAGKTFSVGANAELKRLATDAERIYHLVKQRWFETKAPGPALYAYAEKLAHEHGWELNAQGASGHRVSEFPHAVHHRGKLKGFAKTPSPNRWILEIHLIAPALGRGAFFEDIL